MKRPLALLLCLLSTLSEPWLPAQDAALETTPGDKRPNIVLILADDLGFSDLGCYGGEIETPRLDKLAANGLRFRQFYSTSKCHSSRVSLLTGLYCFQAGNSQLTRGVTLAQVLRSAGYSTTMTGKWHLAGEPTDYGFERYFGHLSGATNFFSGDDSFRLNGKPWSEFDETFYTTDANTDYAIRFLEEVHDDEKPFFLYVAYNAPHYPLHAPRREVEKYRGRYRKGWDRLREERFARQETIGLREGSWKLSPRPDHVPAWDSLSPEERDWEDRRMAAYAGMVDRLDQNIGRLVDWLEAKGELDNTLIAFFSDNGACPFERTRAAEHEPWDARSYWTYDTGWAHAGNTPFRWYKQNQHEGGISSPCIVHWPSGLKTEPGAFTSRPSHLIDWMATVLDVGGAKYPRTFEERSIEPLAGRSLLPIFLGREPGKPRTLYFQFSNNRALRKGPWKAVSARGGPWELYDLSKDRSELVDLSAAQPERAAELAALWHRMARDVERAPARLRKPVKNRIKPWPARRSVRPQTPPQSKPPSKPKR